MNDLSVRKNLAPYKIANKVRFFLTGIAVLMILSQIPTVTGYAAVGNNKLAETINVIAVLSGRGADRRLAELASVTGLGASGDYSLAALGDQS